MTKRRTGLRARILGITTAAAILLSVAIGLSGTAQASTSNGPGAAPHVSLSSSAPAAVACPPGPGPKGFDRTQYCFHQTFAGLITTGDNVFAGAFSFTATHDLRLNARSLDYTEQVTIGSVVTAFAAKGIRISLGDSCGVTCSPVGNNFPVGQVLRNGLHGTLTFHDSVSRGQEQALRNSYTWIALPVGFPVATSTSTTPLFYRCDDMLAGSNPRHRAFPAGCVFPQYTPVLTSMRQLPQIAANISRIQGRGGHYGRIGSGHPLHRITNPTQITANRNVLCPRSRPRPAGMSCDEYPFASTKEGGNGAPPNSRGWAWVPAGEQNSQGGLLNTFYNDNRVLNEDAFWVSV
jgi:Deoxyribonuclease NucA/NucB